jgi:DNA-binding MarR family transcriptional regulator
MAKNPGRRAPELIDKGLKTRKTDGRLAFHLRRAQEASFAAFARRINDDHIWPGWFALLVLVHENPDINQTALSRAVGRDKSTLTTSLRDLVSKGLVQRDRSADDRRNYTLRLTKAGRSRLKKMEVHAHAHDRALDNIVGKESKQALIRILKRIAAEVGQA